MSQKLIFALALAMAVQGLPSRLFQVGGQLEDFKTTNLMSSNGNTASLDEILLHNLHQFGKPGLSILRLMMPQTSEERYFLQLPSKRGERAIMLDTAEFVSELKKPGEEALPEGVKPAFGSRIRVSGK